MDLSVAVERLVTGSPDYRELRELYRDLRAPADRPANDDEVVARHALTQVIEEIADYLDFVQDELEKSVGLTRAVERRRILDELRAPAVDDSLQQVAAVVRSWQDDDTVTGDKLRPVER
jgi:hypothetical protein